MMPGRSKQTSRAVRKTYTVYPVQSLKLKVNAWAVKLHVIPRQVRVQEMRRKWGSCSVAGTITLALSLCEKDEDFQNYVIVHELLHLRYPTHGRMFKVLMNLHVPRWREMEQI